MDVAESYEGGDGEGGRVPKFWRQKPRQSGRGGDTAQVIGSLCRAEATGFGPEMRRPSSQFRGYFTGP